MPRKNYMITFLFCLSGVVVGEVKKPNDQKPTVYKTFTDQIKFEPGSSKLSVYARQTLFKLLTDAGSKGEILSLDAAVWSDKEYPTNPQFKLDPEDRSLAAERIRVLREYVERFSGKAKLVFFNMASRSGGMSELFSTKDADLKRKLEGSYKGKTNPDLLEIVRRAKASSAVILVKIRPKTKKFSGNLTTEGIKKIK